MQWLSEIGTKLEVASDDGGGKSVETCLATVALGTRLRQTLKEMEAHVGWASSVMLKSVCQVGIDTFVHRVPGLRKVFGGAFTTLHFSRGEAYIYRVQVS